MVGEKVIHYHLNPVKVLPELVIGHSSSTSEPWMLLDPHSLKHEGRF